MSESLVKLWEHSDVASTNIDAFRRLANRRYQLKLENYHDLWRWSTEHINDFWMHVWSFTKVVAQAEPTFAIAPSQTKQLFPRPTWFPEARLNFAQNMLESPYARHKESQVVVTGIREGGVEVEHVTLKQLRERVGRLAAAMAELGVQKGNVVACICANSIETLQVFLATASLGAVFTMCSPETGEKGIFDRFLQVRPRLLFADDWQTYNGKRIPCMEKIKKVVSRLEQEAGLQSVVVVNRFKERDSEANAEGYPTLKTFAVSRSRPLLFKSLAFDDPLIVVFSSGTTGKPKCLVHTVGGVLLKQKLEQILCSDMGPSSTHLQYTTTNWIMYLYAATALLSGARAVLYDGSPMVPDSLTLIKVLADQKVTHFGTSAPFLNVLQQKNIPKHEFPKIRSLKVITSTGSVLTEPQYYWVYETFGNVQLSSIAGGTDIAGAFVGGTPDLPVYAGWCQGRTLGMKVQIFSDDGKPVEDSGRAGELVCTAPFPSQPAFFWGDDNGKRYHSSYFEQFPGIWTQGDFIRMEHRTQGIQFLGRSDGVLNPSGVRFGSAEIYNCLTDFSEIEDSLCIGQRRPSDLDERVLLFVKMKQDHRCDEPLKSKIKQHIREQLSPRHVPAYIFETPDIPVTVNGKKTEVPVKKIVCGQHVEVSSTIVNPGSLEWYKQFAKLDQKGQTSRQSNL